MPRIHRVAVIVTITVVAAVTLIIHIVLAAPKNLESEAGTRTGSVAAVADTTASSGTAIQFGTSPGACPLPMRVITAAEVTAHTNSGYPAGTQVYVPGGPDPWGGCFPSADNTGIPTGTTLTNYTGSCTINSAGTVIDSKTINCGTLVVNATGVVIRSSKLNTPDIVINSSGSLTFEDNEVDFGTNPNPNGLVGYNWTVLRSNMYGGKRQVWCNSNCTLQDSYLHDQLSDPTGVTHESAARVEQNTTFTHNSLLCNAPDYPPDAGCSANQTGYPDFAPVHHVTLQRNFYMATSGGFCSYGGGSNGKPYSNDATNATYIRSIDNVFQRGTKPNDRGTIAITDKRRYTCGYYGVTTDYESSKVGFEFTGNRWDDGLLFASDATYPYGGFYE